MKTLSPEKLECILRSIFTFWNKPGLEDSLEKARDYNSLRILKIGQCDTEGIFFVNGDIVKDIKKGFPDFVEGGNDAVYGKKNGEVAKFMPENQIWLDANEDVNSIPYICLHELVERYFMVEHGFKYTDAHDKANEYEMRARRHNIFETRRKVLDFPRVQQYRRGVCGQTCISMILQYFNIKEPVGELEKNIETKEEGDAGLCPESIVELLANFKVEASIKKNPSLEEIKAAIDDNRPVIIELQAYYEGRDLNTSLEDGHYIVAIGHTLDYLIFADPSCFYKTYLKFEELIPRWHDREYDGKINKKLAIFIDSHPSQEHFEGQKTVKQASMKEKWNVLTYNEGEKNKILSTNQIYYSIDVTIAKLEPREEVESTT